MIRKILIANDGSEEAKKALRMATDLAKRYEAELHSIMVEERLPRHKATVVGGALRAEQDAAKYVRTGMIEAGLLTTASGIRLTSHVLPEHEAETIVAFAETHHFDLLVIGFMGHSKIFGEHWGSTSQNLTRLEPCSVLVVK